MDVSGLSVVVTGSSRGIGRAVARAFGRHGARLTCAAPEDDDLIATRDLIIADGGKAIAIAVDISQRTQVDAMVQRAIATYGQIDLLINNAGACSAIGELVEVDPEAWQADIMVNLVGHFFCCRAVLPHMMNRNRGIVVNMAGGGFDRPNPGLSAYASAKAGLMRMTDTLAAELSGRFDIQVYGLWPGFVRTGMTEQLATDPQGQQWLPHVRSGLARREDHAAEDVGRGVVRLVQISCARLSGRIFSYDDDFDRIASDAAAIQERDLHQLRLQTS